MADGYVSAPFETDVAVLLERADQDLRARHPDVQLADGSLIRWQVETDARTAADIGVLALSTSEDLVRAVLARLLDAPASRAVAASSKATLTVTGGARVVVPAGTYLEGTMPDGSPVTVTTVSETTIPSDATTATADVVAVEPGAGANGAEGELLGMEIWPWGVSATLIAPLTGGADAEDPAAHLNRLVQLARLARPRPIRPDDFADYVRLMVPGVGAAVALDKTQPALPAPPGRPPEEATPVMTGLARCVTVGVRAADGLKPSDDAITTAQRALANARETTFQTYVVTADYTTVDVEVTVKVWPGYDVDQTKELVIEAIRGYLSPATWGTPPVSGDVGAGSGPVWAQATQVRVEEIVEAAGRVSAVDYAPRELVKINDVNANLTMPGLLPLPKPGAINVTVVPR